MKQLTVNETAAFLRENDRYVILTHRRPDGDTIGCAAALCGGLRALGKDAAILEGDVVIVRQQPTADSGQIVVALIGEEATVKRLAIKPNGIWLMPENPAFEPIDGRECAILGLVVSLYRPHV